MFHVLGEEIIHKKWGKGVITNQDEKKIFVRFEGSKKEQMILFPDKGYSKYMEFVDPKIEADAQEFCKSGIPLAQITPVKNPNPKFDFDEVEFDKTYDYKKSNFYSYISALDEEIEFVKKNGGKKCRLMNGNLISKTATNYNYAFEKEDDQYFPNDGQIRIIGIEPYQLSWATILSSDEEVVNIRSCIELPKVINFYISTYQILENLSRHVKNAIKNLEEHVPKENKILFKLIKCAKHPKYIDRNKEVLTVNTDDCVRLSKEKKDKNVMFVWGPPGTGKTYTLSKIAVNFVKEKKTVLMLSNSNVAVDGAAIKVRDDSKGMFPKGKILRYGYPHNEELKNDKEITSYNVAVSNYPKLEEKLKSLQEEKKNCKRGSGRYSQILQEIKEIRDNFKGEERKLVEKAKFVASTVAKACMDKILFERKFDVVIVDEASMLLVPQNVFAASLALHRFICVGDFQQLSPIVESEKSEYSGIKNITAILNKDIYDYTGLRELTIQSKRHNWLVMLNTQYRMHPEIANFISKKMYLSKLQSANGMIDKVQETTALAPLPNEPMVIISTTGMLTAFLSTRNKSHFSILHAFLSVLIATKDVKEKDIGIITPHREHSRLINCIVKDLNKNQIPKYKIKVSTVHSFQGSEEDVVIYDVPDCYLNKKPTSLLYRKKTSNKPDLLFNVAMSRAKGKFITLMNGEWIENHLNKSTMFYNYFSEMKDANKFATIDQFLQKSDNNQFAICDSKNAEQWFIEDLKKAENVQMYIPKESEAQSDMKQIMDTLKNFGNKKIVKNGYVIDPITIIDKKIVWYGKPLSKMGFHNKLNDCRVKKFPIFRFVGENTARKIYSLLD